MTPADQELAADIQERVQAIAGVGMVFRAGSLAAKLVEAGAERVGLRGDTAQLVRVDLSAERPFADIAIGSLAATSTIETVQLVHAAAAAAFAAHGGGEPKIQITVMHINGWS